MQVPNPGNPPCLIRVTMTTSATTSQDVWISHKALSSTQHHKMQSFPGVAVRNPQKPGLLQRERPRLCKCHGTN
jgi:hypothetical protein